MKGGDIATVIGGLTAFIGTIYGTWRAARSEKIKASTDSTSILLGGWENFQNNTLKEVERVRTSCQEQIAELKAEHEQDRVEWREREAKWDEEKKSMQDEIDKLKSQVLIHIEKSTREES